MDIDSPYGEEILIPRRPGLSRDEFYIEFQLPRRPVILPDAAANWAATTAWTWAWLSERLGDMRVQVEGSNGKEYALPLHEYIAYTLNPHGYDVPNGPLYMSNFDLRQAPELFDDYERPQVIDDWFSDFPPEHRPPFRWLFLGPGSTGLPLHIDTSGTHGWVTQIIGAKEWRVFPPDDLPEEYCHFADAFAPDLTRHPHFRQAQCHVATLQAGETLFVPYPWRHAVRNTGPSWSLTENYVNSTNLEDVFQDSGSDHVRRNLIELCKAKRSTLEANRQRSPADGARLKQMRRFLAARDDGWAPTADVS